MDIIATLAQQWLEMITGFSPGLKAYIIRLGLGLACGLLLAIHLVRRAGPIEEEFIALRQTAVMTVTALIILFIPALWVDALAQPIQASLLTACLFALLSFPYFLVANLIQTYGRQLWARRILYGLIIFGFLLQLAVSGGG